LKIVPFTVEFRVIVAVPSLQIVCAAGTVPDISGIALIVIE
jgi:hypothetical protein